MTQEAPTQVRGSSRVLAQTRWILLGALLVATVGGAFAYWRYSELYPTTDNAYTGTDIVRVSSEVSGPVVRVYVHNNETVNEGDPLFDIDPAPYEAALREARAQFDRAAQAAGADADTIKASAAALDEKRVALVNARLDFQNAKDALATNPTATEAVSIAQQNWRKALTEFHAAQEDFNKAQDASFKPGPATVQLRAAAAALDRAEHNRARTHVSAPAAGWVSDLTLRPGTTVAAGTPLFALIEGTRWWVDANFKETDIKRIRVGQPATINLDMYPDMTMEGTVDSISAGSGAVFSVLPAENATGNWVKVTQRFTVRIGIPKPPEDAAKPLRVGASASVTIDTTQGTQ